MSNTALRADFFKAGNNGLAAPWEVPCLADRVGRRFKVDPEPLVAAHHEGMRERARRAVQRHLDGIAPTVLGADGAGGYTEIQRGPNIYIGRSLLETAAQAADLPAEDIVNIVGELAPEASAYEGRDYMVRLAEMALEDFQRASARRRFPEPEVDQEQGDCEFLEEIVLPALKRGTLQGGEIRRLGAAAAWRQLGTELVKRNDALRRLGTEGMPAAARRGCPHVVAAMNEDRTQRIALWERYEVRNNNPLRLATVDGETVAPVASMKPPVEERLQANLEMPTVMPPSFDVAREPGLLGDLARWSLAYAFRPIPEFAQLSALATLAPVFGRRFASPTGLGLNLYLVGLATTGSGKEALIGAPPAALQAAGLGFLIGAGDFTSDSAIEVALRARPNFLAPIDEMSEFVGAAQHRNAASHSRTIRKSLLELHSKSRPDARWSGKQKADAEHDKAGDPIFAPHLSILGASTGQGFFESLTEANLADGFINRLIVVQGGKPGDRNLDPSRFNMPAALGEALKAAYEATARGNLAGANARVASQRPDMRTVPWANDAAKDAWVEIADWEDEARDAGREGITGRAAANTQVVATLRALSRDASEPAVTAGDIAWAWSFVRSSIETIERGARENMAGSEFESLVKAIEAVVTKAGPEGIPRSLLLRARGVAKHLPQMVDAAMKRLEEMEVIFKDLRASTGGRPGLRVVAKCFHLD